MAAPPTPTPKPGGGPLSKLNPRQKKIAAAAGVALVLALIVALQRGGGGGAAPAEEAGAEPTAAGSAGAPPFGSTFADNGEAAGQLGTSITEGLGAVAASNEGVQFALEDLSDQLKDQAATTTGDVAPGEVGKVGSPKKPPKPLSPKTTSNHARAGLHRTGTNRYVDKRGRSYKRVGKGRDSHFEPIKPKKARAKPKPKPKPKPPAKPRKPSTPPKSQPKPPAKKKQKPGGRRR